MPAPTPHDGIGLRSRLQLFWEPRHNAQAQDHARNAHAVALALGMLPTAQDSARLQAFVQIDSFVLPVAPLPRLDAAGRFFQWLYFLDDQYDDDLQFAGDQVGVRRVMERALALLRGGALQPDATPFERFTQRVHEDLAALSTPAWRQRFLAEVEAYLFGGTLVSLQHWQQGGPPGVVEYMAMRELDSSVFPCISVGRLADAVTLPAEVLEHPLVRALERHTVRHVAFTNDLVSYQKEVLRMGSPCNLVHVIARDAGLGLEAAVERVLRIINAEAHGFEGTRAALPTFGAAIDAELGRYLDGMTAWIRGNLEFSLQSARFRAADSPFLELRPGSVAGAPCSS